MANEITTRSGSQIVTSAITATPTAPRRNFVESALTRFSNNHNARALDAETRFVNSHTNLIKADVARTNALVDHQGAMLRLAENPEKLGHELAVRRIERTQSFLQKRHVMEVSLKRQRSEILEIETDLTYKKADLTRARVVLLDAEQQLEAQSKYGPTTHKVAHRQKLAELLAIELDDEERRAVLKKSLKEMDKAGPEGPTDEITEIDDALIARRDQLNAAGLSTDAIDKVIAQRRHHAR